MITRSAAGLAAALLLGLAASGTASAGGFGSSVSSCAQTMLGQRANPPTVTCECDAATFATFGAMVEAMKP